MFKRFVTAVEILTLIGFAVFVALLFIKQPPSSSSPVTPPSSSSSSSGGGTASSSSGGGGAVDAAGLYRSNCASCHGSKGQGGIGPQLGNGAVARSIPDAGQEKVIIVKGEGGMPSFGSQLSDAEITALVDFTRNQLGK